MVETRFHLRTKLREMKQFLSVTGGQKAASAVAVVPSEIKVLL